MLFINKIKGILEILPHLPEVNQMLMYSDGRFHRNQAQFHSQFAEMQFYCLTELSTFSGEAGTNAIIRGLFIPILDLLETS